MEIEFKARTKVPVMIYGRSFELTKPTVGQIEAVQGEITKEGVNQIKVMSTFAQNLGLPADVIAGMETEHFLELMERLTGQKKK